MIGDRQDSQRAIADRQKAKGSLCPEASQKIQDAVKKEEAKPSAHIMTETSTHRRQDGLRAIIANEVKAPSCLMLSRISILVSEPSRMQGQLRSIVNTFICIYVYMYNIYTYTVPIMSQNRSVDLNSVSTY